MQIIETKGYDFTELNKEAKQKAIEWYRENNIDDSWEWGTIEECKEVGDFIGIDIERLLFTGFSSQGDGACFEGSYSYKPGSLKTIKEYAPLDKELQKIARHLQLIQSTNFYQLTGVIKHSGRYYHDKCTDIFIERSDGKEISGFIQTEYALIGALREFMQWTYKQLNNEWDHLTSDESATEFLTDNDHYLFTDKGEFIQIS